MISFITLDGLKTALTEMKKYISDKFYNKSETENLLNQTKGDINTSITGKFNDFQDVIIPQTVENSVNDELSRFEANLDTMVQEKVDAKPIDTSGLVTKEELSVDRVLTLDNYSTNHIATLDDIPKVVTDTDFTSMITDLTSDGGVY